MEQPCSCQCALWLGQFAQPKDPGRRRKLKQVYFVCYYETGAKINSEWIIHEELVGHKNFQVRQSGSSKYFFQQWGAIVYDNASCNSQNDWRIRLAYDDKDWSDEKVNIQIKWFVLVREEEKVSALRFNALCSEGHERISLEKQL